MLKQGVITAVRKPMKSRNTAPRLSIDFGPGCFLQLNKSDISPLKCWLSWWRVSSFQPPFPWSKVTSLLCSGQSQQPLAYPWCAHCPWYPGRWLQGRCQLWGWSLAESRCPLIKLEMSPQKAKLGSAEQGLYGHQKKCLHTEFSNFRTHEASWNLLHSFMG